MPPRTPAPRAANPLEHSQPADQPRSRPSVLMIGSEALPFSKTGGLADVLGALPLALGRAGWDVTLAVPRYRGTTTGASVERVRMQIGGMHADVGYFQVPLAERVQALLIDEPTLYDREHLYASDSGDYPDNARRYAVLVRAALDFAARRGTRPTVVHGHDWQAGLAPVFLKTTYAAHAVLGGLPSVFTIHNMAYQGLFEPDWLPRLDLPWSLLGVDELEFWGKISFLKGGIQHADVITTVSPQYAKEIQTPEFGAGLDGVLRQRSNDLFGILNGIDTEQWDPASDPHLPQPFSADNPSAKRASKVALLERYGLPGDATGVERPLIGMISRMVDQKGFDLIASLAAELPRLDATFVVLGTGDPRYQDLWRTLAGRYPDRIGARIGFDEALAHLIEAGADMFLMPSRFEPCGLNQMYSLRYGTVPIVRRVGGLADTVTDERAASLPGGAARRPNGFVFEDYTPEALLATLRRALTVFRDQTRWRALQLAGMAEDHSWDRSAREYVKMYDRAVTKGDPNGSGQRADLYGR